jgi:antitoxin (DNA-binding transcriptional repressor) of toxin-antitoxin stability system
MEEFTVKQFQEKFDSLLDRVEHGESFRIRDGKKVVMMVPSTTMKYFTDEDELVRIHTDHEEGS